MKLPSICIALLLTSCISPRVETGAWNYSLIRVPYNIPLTSPVSVGRVEEIQRQGYLPIGDYVPLPESRHSSEWENVYSTKKTTTPYLRELSDVEIKAILEILGLSSKEAREAAITRMAIRAVDRRWRLSRTEASLRNC